ncbi:hypothetical protein BVG16_22185 [Paenibacillus selenitireducens]|uniref:Uncharacterized protein n=1 Tax=Paenibacillus selenitireducens TaxID=1324314 RepID=A0A1T2X604_9BACL|nr:hypothetical protein [Paenibacillus selenitireducens]OPA75307.1 hypothetical protein BVG16_22185 [Paenibacillus selenitireducens]
MDRKDELHLKDLANSIPPHRRMFISLLIGLFLLTLMLLGLIDLWTFRLKPGGHLSGNGNPALLFVFLFLPLYILFLTCIAAIAQWYIHLEIKQGTYHWGILTFMIVITLLIIGCEMLYFRQIFYSLGGFPNSAYSAIYRWSTFNQYTNTAYINVFTYILGVLAALFIGYMIAVVRSIGRRKD